MSSVKEYHQGLLAAGASAADVPADVPTRPRGDQQQGADAAAGTRKAAKRASGKGTGSKEVGGLAQGWSSPCGQGRARLAHCLAAVCMSFKERKKERNGAPALARRPWALAPLPAGNVLCRGRVTRFAMRAKPPTIRHLIQSWGEAAPMITPAAAIAK
jgi:hypothetical protein